MTDTKRRRLSWFLPANPDVLEMLRRQARVTIEGMESLVAWATGDPAAADMVRAKEHQADDVKRELRVALRNAFITPIGAEDIYVLSERLDAVMNGAKDAVREAEVMALRPDDAIAAMASLLVEAVHRLADAFARLEGHDGEEATAAADAAIKAGRDLEHVYRNAMSELVKEVDVREVMGRRELYRRFSRISEDTTTVAERVWYASVKEA